MKYVIVSTYPREGSQNIGDKLIERATALALQNHDPEAKCTSVWRADSWDNVKNTILAADHVVFACLAIRANMQKIYPYLENILNQGVPASVLAAGTSLAVLDDHDFNPNFSQADIALFQRLAAQACVFTTRGALTQQFCRAHGMTNATFSGDVAFWDNRFEGRQFEASRDIQRIAISDPHAAEIYAPIFVRLAQTLARQFPKAQTTCLLHGRNPLIETAAAEHGIEIEPIYQNPDSGLDAYDTYDLHVGFRVHGHVSALQRRKPSYLFEQDGRGADYGLSLDKKISIPCYRLPKRATAPAKPAKSLFGAFSKRQHAPASGAQSEAADRAIMPGTVHLMEALIAQDAENGFAKFSGLEEVIAGFNTKTSDAVRHLIGQDR